MYDVMSAFLLGDHIGNKTYMQKVIKVMIVSNGEKFIKLDGYLSAIVYSNSDWKFFLTLLKIKNTEKKILNHNL